MAGAIVIVPGVVVLIVDHLAVFIPIRRKHIHENSNSAIQIGRASCRERV